VLLTPVFGPLAPIAILASVLLAGASASAVTLSVVSPAPVKSSGDTASVCLALDAGSESVAGVMNDLTWDSNCLTMVDRCVASPGLGKNLSVGPRGSSGMRAIILSMGDVNPITSNQLYCCTFRVELQSPGSCCSVNVVDAQSSSPRGEALNTFGRGGQVCLASGPSAAGGIQPPAGGEPQAVVGADVGAAPREAAPAQAPAAAAPKGGAVGAAPPAVVVLPRGEERREEPEAAPAEQQIAEAPVGQAPGAPVERAPGAPAEKAAGVSAETAAPVAPTAAVTANPTPGEAASVAAKPTLKPTPKLPVKPTPAQPKAAAPTKAEGGGCNCQIGSGGSDGSLLASLVMLGVLLLARRKRI